MLKLRFLDSETLYDVELPSATAHIQVVKFLDGNVIENTSGFEVHEELPEMEEDREHERAALEAVDEENNWDVTSYANYTTINNVILERGIVWFSDDGSVYQPPTAEQEAARQRAMAVSDAADEIEALNTLLAQTDYIMVKCYEKSLIGEETPPEYDLSAIATERQSYRDRINELQALISDLETEGGDGNG